MSSFVSLDGRRTGMTVVAVAATVSFVLVAATLLYATITILRYRKRSAYERSVMQDDPAYRGVKFLTSDYGLLFFSLMCGELLQALGFSLNYEWIARNGRPANEPTATCFTQALFIQMGDLATAFSTFLLAIHLFSIIVLSYKFPKKLLIGSLVFIWTLVAFFGGLGPGRLAEPGRPFYAWAGAWCWIGADFEIYRLWFHYLFVFIVAFGNIALYSIIFFKLARQRKVGGQAGASSVSKIMLIYPLVYLVGILPISTIRLAAIAGHRIPPAAQMAAGTLFTLSGAADVIVYVLTRQIVNVSQVSSAFRRRSEMSRSGQQNTQSNQMRSGAISDSRKGSVAQASPTSVAFLISTGAGDRDRRQSLDDRLDSSKSFARHQQSAVDPEAQSDESSD